VVPFDIEKIKTAVRKAMVAVLGEHPEVDKDVNQVCKSVQWYTLEDDRPVTVEELQDIVESALMCNNYFDVAKAYILYRNRRTELRSCHPDQKLLSDYIHTSKYAKPGESYEMTVRRTEEMHLKRWPSLRDLIHDAFGYVYTKRVLPSMRSMQSGGADIERHNARLYNCLGVETRFITTDGVKSFDYFKDGDETTVLSHTGQWRKAKVRHYGRGTLNTITLKRRASVCTVRATSDHRWVLSDGSITDHLVIDDRVAAGSYVIEDKWEAYSKDQREEWCLGFIYGDGSFYHRGKVAKGNYLRLCGDKADYLSRFDEFFEVDYTASFDDPVVRLKGLIRQTIPSAAFVAGWLAADGFRDKLGRIVGIQITGSENAAWLRRWLPKFGYYILKEFPQKMETNYGRRSGETVRFSIFRHSDYEGYNCWIVDNIEESCEDDLWCLEVEVDHSFTLANGVVTGNCCATLVDRPEVFGQTMYLLLCGCGVGYSVQKQHVAKLPAIGVVDYNKVRYFRVDDSVEGWADAVTELVLSNIDGYYVEFDYSKIRPRGAPLSSGGKAPGHLPLKKTLENIRAVLTRAAGRRLRPIECYDMMCYVAEAVLSGGIRRSSEIALFSPDDDEMMHSKDAENYDFVNKNPQRAMSNNSVVLLRPATTEEQFRDILKVAVERGEPGFFFTDNLDYVCNPCGEVGLYPVIDGKTGFAFCNLTEINAAKFESGMDFLNAAQAAAVIGTLQASYTEIPYLGKVTEEIMERDAMIGVSITGIMDCPEIALNPGLQQKAAKMVMDTNYEVAAKIGLNLSPRCTTVKPGGTAPLELGGVASGIRPHHSRRYFRRVTANPLEPAAKLLKEVNPHMVAVKPNGDWCITFPVEAPRDAITVDNMPAVQFMNAIFSTYQNWVLPGTRPYLTTRERPLTHNISATVVVKPGEVDEVMALAWKNRENIAAMSFLPASSDKVYPYMPQEAVVTEADENLWRCLVKNCKPVNFSQIKQQVNVAAGEACAGGACDIVRANDIVMAEGALLDFGLQYNKPMWEVYDDDIHFTKTGRKYWLAYYVGGVR
jgi:ribonucleoside-diphosphate reductase alpha chain